MTDWFATLACREHAVRTRFWQHEADGQLPDVERAGRGPAGWG